MKGWICSFMLSFGMQELGWCSWKNKEATHTDKSRLNQELQATKPASFRCEVTHTQAAEGRISAERNPRALNSLPQQPEELERSHQTQLQEELLGFLKRAHSLPAQHSCFHSHSPAQACFLPSYFTKG